LLPLAKISVRPRKNTAEGGVGGIPPCSCKKEASPAACIVKNRSQQKSFLFLLPARRSFGAGRGEKIWREQRKIEKVFLLAGER
jgi:hypothetical protein